MPKAGRARRAWVCSSLAWALLAVAACERNDAATAAASGEASAALGSLGQALAPGEGTLPASPLSGPSAAAPGAGALPRSTPAPISAAAQSDDAYERFAGSTFRVQQILQTLATSPLSDLRPVGTTSVVLRATLNAPFRAALKLGTRDRPLAAAAEAAAYRLSRCLGLTTVPPVVLRHPPVLTLEHALERSFVTLGPDLFARAAVDAHSEVEVAAIFWVEGMRDLPIATREGREPALRALLQGNAISRDLQLMAAQLSDLSVFDWLLGNGDRWSGGNVQGDATGQWLYLRDHDLSFAAPLRADVEDRLLTQLSQVERFSRGLMGRLRALTREQLQAEWERDPQLVRRGPWLRERVLPGIMQRRSRLLSDIQRLVLHYGEPAVLVFP